METYTLIIKSTSTLSFCPSIATTEWTKVRGTRDDKDNLVIKHYPIERADAKKYIANNSFEIVFRNNDGIIYGNPDEDFKNILAPEGLTRSEREAIGRW